MSDYDLDLIRQVVARLILQWRTISNRTDVSIYIGPFSDNPKDHLRITLEDHVRPEEDNRVVDIACSDLIGDEQAIEQVIRGKIDPVLRGFIKRNTAWFD